MIHKRFLWSTGRRFLTFFLAMGLALSLIPPQKGFALESDRFDPEARMLYRLGLFYGNSAETYLPGLDAALDRQTGVVLLLNLFGDMNAVQAQFSGETERILSAFGDASAISPWARPYMAYAVSMGLLAGTPDKKLLPASPLSGKAFAAMLLRRMGYPGDPALFNQSLELLDKKGAILGEELTLFNKNQLLKGDAVGMAYKTLFGVIPSGDLVVEQLVRDGTVDADKAVSQRLLAYTEPGVTGPLTWNEGPLKSPEGEDVLYMAILDGLLNMEEKIVLPVHLYPASSDKIFRLIEQVVLENPVILYYSGCTYNKTTGLLELNYREDRETGLAHSKVLREKALIVLNEVISPGMSAYDKALAIHDYVVENCAYDYENYTLGQIPPASYSAYGSLVLGVAVCEGYAEAMQLLLSRAGVESRILLGTSRDVSHAWNLVKLNGEYTHIDATWDDPVTSDGTQLLLHDYFNLTDEEIGADHNWAR